MSSRKAALSPLNLTPCGPERLRLASTRSSLREDRHLAKTASPETKRRREGGEGQEGRHLKPVKSNTGTEMIAEPHKHDSAVFKKRTKPITKAAGDNENHFSDVVLRPEVVEAIGQNVVLSSTVPIKNAFSFRGQKMRPSPLFLPVISPNSGAFCEVFISPSSILSLCTLRVSKQTPALQCPHQLRHWAFFYLNIDEGVRVYETMMRPEQSSEL